MPTEDKINKYLTEQIGECWHPRWHKAKGSFGDWTCSKCGYRKGHSYGISQENIIKYHSNTIDFFTPDGFFELWNWSIEQKWWAMFLFSYFHGDYMDAIGGAINTKYINPTTFANVIYKFLKERSNA